MDKYPRRSGTGLAIIYCIFVSFQAAAVDEEFLRPAQFSGMCDASGAVAVSSNLFVVASDEDNTLRLYRTDQAGPPIKSFDMNGFLQLKGKSLEADLEGAAKIGNRAFWIGSHGRNRDGKARPNRCRLFATDIKGSGNEFDLAPVGRPYRNLLEDLAGDSRFDRFRLLEAAQKAPKEPGALNIEGLSATGDGHLLIGFRNPIPDGKALLIPLLNPDEVVAGLRGRFGAPIQLDLGGHGVRDIAWFGGAYLIIAGSYHGGGKFQVFRWAGPGTEPAAISVGDFKGYTPESVIIYPGLGLSEVQILSDDGTRLVDGKPCKDCPEVDRRTFRSFWIKP